MYSAAELDFLISQRARVEELLQLRQAQGPLTKQTRLDDATFFRKHLDTHGEFARAVLELATARSSAASKLPAHWLMCHDSAQQATHQQVVALRAQKLAAAFPGATVHDVTCSIGAEALLTQAGLNYLGSDIDPIRVRMARENNPQASWMVADATQISSRAEVVLADPARRSGGRRISCPADLIPPLPTLLDRYAGRPLAIKCAPGLDFSEWSGVVSLTSVQGSVKEACLYSPDFSLQGERREAWVIGAAGVDHITDISEPAVPTAAPGRFVLDPDGAIVRAGLVQHFAAREGLWMLDPRIAYLTGDRIPRGYSGFKFIQATPLKKLREVLRDLDAGALEILVRGVDVDADKLRKKLKLRGRQPYTVVCLRIGKQAQALVCGPRQWADD